MKKLLILLLLIQSIAFSQGGSNYSSIGIGDINLDNGSVYSGLAGTSIAIPNPNTINIENPATWSELSLTRLQMSYKFNQSMISTGDLNHYQNFGKVDGFSAVFALDTSNGIALGLGFSNYSDINYRVSSRFDAEIETISTQGKKIETGSGGVSNAYIGLTGMLFNMISLSVTPTYYFGSINELSEVIYDDNFGLDVFVDRDRRVSGFGYKLATFIQLNKNVNIGAYYNSAVDLDIQSLNEYGLLFSPIPISLDTVNSAINIPETIGFGYSFVRKNYILGMDISFQDFSDMNFKVDELSSLTNLNSYSIGLSKAGSKKSSAKGLQTWDFRAGLGYKNLQYQIQGDQISEIYGALGTSIPFGTYSYFDLGMVVGNRGRSSDLLVSETFVRFNFNLSIGDTWFTRFDRGYDDVSE